MASETSDVNTFQSALDQLAPALDILDAFNRRHKNQHRSSRWWAQFDILRRATRKLAPSVERAAQSQQRKTAVSGGTNRKGVSKAGREEIDAVETRARWMREHVAPRVFLAFTQLASDNQYAPLGLLLLGVLAQVNTAIETLTGVDTQVVIEAGPSSARGNDPLPWSRSPTTKVETDVDDFGIAVSRDESRIEQVTQVVPYGGQAMEAGPREQLHGKVAVEAQEPGKTEISPQPKKRRKRRKGDDEFDDLFSNLV